MIWRVPQFVSPGQAAATANRQPGLEPGQELLLMVVPLRILTPADPAATRFALLLREVSTEVARLQRGVELAVSLVHDCDHASVTVLTPHYLETVAVSDDVVSRGDGWQHELSEGPGLDSVRSRTTVISQDLRSDPRWRSWGPRAAELLGVRATLSVLFDAAPDVVGSLNLYSDREQVWDDGQQLLARALGDQLAVAVADARLLDERERAMVARVGLGQAQGIVMERYGMTAEQAFDHLQRLSEVTRVPLVHLAERIVVTRELPGPAPEGDSYL
jgi:GAF domain-containing protein